MALNFVAKTYQQILDDMFNRVTNTIDKRELSIISVSLRPCAWTIEGIYLDLVALQRDAYALTAIGDALDYKVAERGLSRKPATFAVRLGRFDVDVAIGTRYKTMNGANSVIFSVTTKLGLNADGYYHCQCTCETAGIIGNDYTGNVVALDYNPDLRFAEITDIIVSGADIETDEELRERYLFDLRRQPFAGNIAAYIKWFLDGADMGNRNTDNIGAVQVYPHSNPMTGNQAGYVTCSAIDRNYEPLTTEVIEQLQYDLCPPAAGDNDPSEYGYGYAPIGSRTYVVTPTNFTVNVTVNVELKSNYTVDRLRSDIESAISSYFLEIRRSFGEQSNAYEVNYTRLVYMSRIAAAIVGIEGVTNVSSVLLNGTAADITLTMQPTLQQLVQLGSVTINAV